MIPVNYADLFSCPISYERMKDPVMHVCGNTFDRAQINGWMNDQRVKGEDPTCPLCRAPIDNVLSSNILIKKAIDALNLDDPDSLANRIEDLTTEEREEIDHAVANVMARRDQNRLANIPDRLDQPRSFSEKIGDFCCSANQGC